MVQGAGEGRHLRETQLLHMQHALLPVGLIFPAAFLAAADEVVKVVFFHSLARLITELPGTCTALLLSPYLMYTFFLFVLIFWWGFLLSLFYSSSFSRPGFQLKLSKSSET